MHDAIAPIAPLNPGKLLGFRHLSLSACNTLNRPAEDEPPLLVTLDRAYNKIGEVTGPI